jgi:hypothetical protein
MAACVLLRDPEQRQHVCITHIATGHLHREFDDALGLPRVPCRHHGFDKRVGRSRHAIRSVARIVSV